MLLYSWFEKRYTDETDPVDDLRDQYVAGDLTPEEFEDRVALELDDRAQETRQRLECIDGIGPDTSAIIARRFRTLDELREASREEIKDVHGIGPSTSKAIRQSLD
nr:helix-hairpin-helix domain-containing protein [Halorubellus sp. JP-L1]